MSLAEPNVAVADSMPDIKMVSPPCIELSKIEWDFQDPKMEVLYHMFGRIFRAYPLTEPKSIGLIYCRYLQFRFLK